MNKHNKPRSVTRFLNERSKVKEKDGWDSQFVVIEGP